MINSNFGKVFATSGISITFYPINDLEICIIDIKKWNKPLYLEVLDKNGQKHKKFYVRTGNSSQELGLDEISDYINSRFNGDLK